jgi:nucleoside-diphosphate-sugar epimerase
MNILIVGGTGLIGAEAALLLREQGHQVTIMARKPSRAPAIAALPFVAGDYVHDDSGQFNLAQYEALVFCAGADIRYLPQDGSVTAEDFYSEVNDRAVPAFIAAAKAAGVRRAVYMGTFYPQLAPEKMGVCPYVSSRHNTDLAVRALVSNDFNVCSLNLPFVLGKVPGVEVAHIDALVAYAKGQLEGVPVFAPRGGTNHISSLSVAHAISSALTAAEAGRAYLLGDVNLSWQAYLEAWFSVVGNPQTLAVLDDDHPLLPNVIMFAGAGVTISYEPDTELDYPRGQIPSVIEAIVGASGQS